MSYTTESGWKATRAAGVLNFYLAANPQMSYAEILSWAAANGLPDWEPTLETSDSALIATDGKIRWDDNYDYPANWLELFNDWKNNGVIAAELPQPPSNTNILTTEIAAAAAAVEAVAPAPVPVIVIEPAPPAPAPVAIPQAPDPLSFTTPPQVNPTQAPSPIDFVTPPQVQPALVAPQAVAEAPSPIDFLISPQPGTVSIFNDGDGALLKIALGLLLI